MISLLLCLLILCIPALQAKAEVYDPWHYEIEDDHVVINGYYGNESGHVEIPSSIEGYPVTHIGNSAFLGRDITGVTFPDTVTSIGDFSFAHCPNLTTVNISENVTFIDIGAFVDCENLTGIWVDPQNWDYSSDEQGVLYSKNKMKLVQVPGSFQGSFEIPEGVIYIGFAAFEGCSGLTDITIAESVREIEGYAFCSCTELSRLYIPSLVQYIGKNAFENCTKLTCVDVAEDNPYFCSDENGTLYTKDKSEIIYVPGAFAGDYVVPKGTTKIGDDFFADCPGLTSVTIPEGVTHIGNYAFYNCKNLKSVCIAESVVDIDAYAFQHCLNLSQVNIPRNVTHIKWGLFRGCRMLTQLPIHDQVVIIDDFAFAECHSLTDIVIPASVEYVGHYAFHDCRGLQNIYFCGDAPEFVNHENINGSFSETRANAYYHKGTQGWTEEAKSKTGGYITWTELDHIVLDDGQDAYCVVCGEKAEKNTPVEMTSADTISDSGAPVDQTKVKNDGAVPDEKETTQNSIVDMPHENTPDAPNDSTNDTPLRNPRITDNPKTADLFSAISGFLLVVMAAVLWVLVKARFVNKDA